MSPADVVVSMEYCLTEVWAVLPERVVERATIVVEDGLIVSVVENGPATPGAFSGRGGVCIPGIVDAHSVSSLERSEASTGVTTQLHALRRNAAGDNGDTTLARALCERADADRSMGSTDHRPILVVDLDDHSGLAEAERCARACVSERGTLVVAVAEHDITAGRDVAAEALLAWFTIQALAQRLRLLAIAPATADDVDRAVDWGATAIEFPTSIDAARRAHERGMHVVASASDVVMAPSVPTAVSPLALIELGLCDALASVERSSSLVDAVSLLVVRGVCDLRSAVRLVTSSPAEVTGLTDRGRLASGLRGDLVLLRPDRERFRVRHSFRAGVAEPAHLAS